MSDGYSSAIGASAGGVSSLVGAFLSYKNAKKLQEHQYQLNQRALRNQYQNTRYSLTQAGYNPLLAVGANAQGFSANSSGTPVDLTTGIESGINSAISLRTAKEQLSKLKEETKSVELDNRLKRKELDTSPRSIISDLVRGEGDNNPVIKFVKDVGNKLGITSNSAVSSLKGGSNLPITIKLHNDKPYVQKGVPASVVKQFNSAVSSNKFKVLTDKELYNYKPKKFYISKPPKEPLQ